MTPTLVFSCNVMICLPYRTEGSKFEGLCAKKYPVAYFEGKKGTKFDVQLDTFI